MKIYFIIIDGKQEGPFSIEDLKDMHVTRDSMIWFGSLDKWVKANHIQELKPLFDLIPPPISTPPPINTQSSNSISNTPPSIPSTNNKTLNKIKIKKTVIFALSLLTLTVVIIGIYMYNNRTDDIYKTTDGTEKVIPAKNKASENKPKKQYRKLNKENLGNARIFTSNGKNVNIRVTPDTKSAVIYQLQRGEEVVYLNKQTQQEQSVIVNGEIHTNYWVYVQAINNADAIGWVHADFLNL